MGFFDLLHGKADAVALFIYGQHHDLNDVTNLQHLAGMLQPTVAHFADMHQTVLMNADVHEDTKVDDITHRTGQLHAGDQILHFQHILPQYGGRQLVTGVTTGLGKLLGDVDEGHFAHTALFGSGGGAVGFQTGA